VHGLKGAPGVTDIRSVGLAAGIDIDPDPAAPGRRGYDAMRLAFAEENLVIRISGDTIALSPPLIATESDFGRIVEGLRAILARLD
jgi:beta-alanine--pyruvate transaminase